MSTLLDQVVCDRLRFTKEVALAVFVAENDNADDYSAAWRAFDRAEVFVAEYDRRYELQEDAAEIAQNVPFTRSLQDVVKAEQRLVSENAYLKAQLAKSRKEIANLQSMWVARENRGYKGRVPRAGL